MTGLFRLQTNYIILCFSCTIFTVDSLEADKPEAVEQQKEQEKRAARALRGFDILDPGKELSSEETGMYLIFLNLTEVLLRIIIVVLTTRLEYLTTVK